MTATQTATEHEVRNEKVWFGVCSERHFPLFDIDKRPNEVDICTVCGVPKKLTSIGEGFVSHEERNKGWADSFPLAYAKGPILPDRL
jgi:hypothetical protein